MKQINNLILCLIVILLIILIPFKAKAIGYPIGASYGLIQTSNNYINGHVTSGQIGTIVTKRETINGSWQVDCNTEYCYIAFPLTLSQWQDYAPSDGYIKSVITPYVQLYTNWLGQWQWTGCQWDNGMAFCRMKDLATNGGIMEVKIMSGGGELYYNIDMNTIYVFDENESSKVSADLDDIKNTDVSSDTKTMPNQDDYNNTQQKEEVVYDSLDDININTLVDMQIDTNSSNWIWNTITSILQANARVMTMVISILSLGLCKFVLGR